MSHSLQNFHKYSHSRITTHEFLEINHCLLSVKELDYRKSWSEESMYYIYPMFNVGNTRYATRLHAFIQAIKDNEWLLIKFNISNRIHPVLITVPVKWIHKSMDSVLQVYNDRVCEWQCVCVRVCDLWWPTEIPLWSIVINVWSTLPTHLLLH